MAKLILVRNGQTDLERRGFWPVQGHTELSDQGRFDAMQAGALLARTAIHFAYTAEQLQSRQTADRILQLQEVRPEVIPTRALNERNLGVYAGKHERQLQAVLGRRQMELLSHSWDHQVAGGETMREVYERRIVPFHTKVVRPLPEEIEEPDPTVLVVAAEDPMRGYAKLLEPLSAYAVRAVEFASGEVRSYEMSEAGAAVLLDDSAI